MPGHVRQVGFAPIPATYSRLPHDDELYVMRAFAKHASHCTQCGHPYDVHLKGKTLCTKGHKRALDVAQYVFSKAGHAFSVVDLDANKRMEVEIPSDCAAVRELLKAVEHGLRLREAKPIISYDENYYVAPRRSLEHDPQYREQPRSYLSSRHQRNGRPSSHRQPTIYYTVGSKGTLPVSRKDNYWP
ncbi:MAG: hypothetical protein Q9217_006961 [Psora testacea]